MGLRQVGVEHQGALELLAGTPHVPLLVVALADGDQDRRLVGPQVGGPGAAGQRLLGEPRVLRLAVAVPQRLAQTGVGRSIERVLGDCFGEGGDRRLQVAGLVEAVQKADAPEVVAVDGGAGGLAVVELEL